MNENKKNANNSYSYQEDNEAERNKSKEGHKRPKSNLEMVPT